MLSAFDHSELGLGWWGWELEKSSGFMGMIFVQDYRCHISSRNDYGG